MTHPTPSERPDGIAADAWLREALRHAPDADAAVPTALRETILRRARAAVQPAVPAAQRSRWRQWIDGWLRPTRLGYSGAFVVLLVVGVWGLDGLDEQARAPLAPARPEAVVAEAAPAVAASTPTPTAARVVTDVPTPVVAAAAAKTQRRVAVAAVGARAPAAAPGPDDVALAAAGESARSDSTAAAALPERAAAAAATSAPPPPPAPALASPAPVAAPPVLAERAAVSDTVSDTGTRATAVTAAAPAAPRATAAAPAMASALPKATPPGVGSALRAARQDRAGWAALDPLATLLQRASADASMRWTVGSREGSVGAAQRAWLDALRVDTAGRWTRASAAPAAPAMQLSSSSGALATLSVEAPATLWIVIGTSVYRAPLSEAALARFEEPRSAW